MASCGMMSTDALSKLRYWAREMGGASELLARLNIGADSPRGRQQQITVGDLAARLAALGFEGDALQAAHRAARDVDGGRGGTFTTPEALEAVLEGKSVRKIDPADMRPVAPRKPYQDRQEREREMQTLESKLRQDWNGSVHNIADRNDKSCKHFRTTFEKKDRDRDQYPNSDPDSPKSAAAAREKPMSHANSDRSLRATIIPLSPGRMKGLAMEEALNDRDMPVKLGTGKGAGTYYCGSLLCEGGRTRCGPEYGPQCQSCDRFQKERNDAGHPVQVGRDGRFYCGITFEIGMARPRKKVTCGPGGPQCQSCRRKNQEPWDPWKKDTKEVLSPRPRKYFDDYVDHEEDDPRVLSPHSASRGSPRSFRPVLSPSASMR